MGSGGIMFHGIGSQGGPAWSQGVQPQQNARSTQRSSQQARAQASASVLDAQVSRTGALQVTTDDGDTVSISFAALQQLHAESFRGKAGGARADYGSTSQTSGVSVDINVNGSLNDKEVADIGKLLQELSQAISDPNATGNAGQLGPAQFANGGALDSLSNFQFAYQEQTQVDYSSSRVGAAA
jgi:hypothetical protein